MNFISTGGAGQESVDAEELVQMVDEGVTGYKSLSGDGPMDTPEAVVVVGRAVVLVGFILAIAGIVLFNVVL